MKRIYFSLIAMLCYVVMVNAQGFGTVIGAVVEDEFHQFVKDASVEIIAGSMRTKTTTEGFFEFQKLPPNEYKIQIVAVGYHTQFVQFTIKAGETTNLGTIVLVKSSNTFKDVSIVSLTDDDLSDDGNRSPSYVSGLFQSSKDVYLKAAAYNFSQAWFKVRGYDSRNGVISINGIEMNKLFDGRPQWSNWGGLNDVFKNQEFSNGLAPSAYTFGNVLGSTNFNIRASDYNKGGKVSLSSTNKSYQGRLMATYATGVNEKGWAFSVSASRRMAKEGYFEGATYNAWSGFLAIEKKLNNNNGLNFTAFVASNRRGKSSPNTQEVYDLKGYQYNAYWGNQLGDKRNSRIKEIFEPVLMLSHFYEDEKMTLSTSVSYQFGKIGNSRLGYFNAPNPDPTYWKYLPSSFLRFPENPDYENAYLAEQEFLNNGQVKWEDLYDVNVNNKNSLYYLYEDRVDDGQFSFSSVLNYKLSPKNNINASISYRNLVSNNFANMLDLLGGEGFVDLDPYAFGDAEQNDLNNPNRTVVVGDKFQYNYKINAAVFNAFVQLQHIGNKVDYFIAANVKSSNYQREGLYKNGSFPTNSYGTGEKQSFFDVGFKGGLTYKISGRHLVNLNAGYIATPPTIRNSFSNGRVNNNITPNLKSENIATTDVSYIFRMPKFQGRITGFYTKFSNAIETSFFFAEGLRGDQADFVNEIVTGVEKKHIGAEFSIQYQPTTTISVLAGGSVGQFTYANNPNLFIQSETFTEENGDFGTAYLKNYKVSGTPQRGYSLGVEYRDPDYWWFQVNGNYLTHNYLDIAPILRTDNFYLDADGIPFIDDETGEQVTQEQINSLLVQEKFDDAFLLNLVGGKSWLVNGKYFGFFAGINNILGALYKSGGFEQSRNVNYPELKQDKKLNKPVFGPKYWYGMGTSYYINLYVRF